MQKVFICEIVMSNGLDRIQHHIMQTVSLGATEPDYQWQRETVT